MIQMPWFLPLGLSIGAVLTRTTIQIWRERGNQRHRREGWLLFIIGWIPLLAWLACQFVAQY